MKKILALILAVTFVLASVPAFAGTENDDKTSPTISFSPDLSDLPVLWQVQGFLSYPCPLPSLPEVLTKQARHWSGTP